MNKERFIQLCHDVNVDDPQMIDHIWQHHTPPENVSDEEVRDTVPDIAAAHKAAQMLTDIVGGSLPKDRLAS